MRGPWHYEDPLCSQVGLDSFFPYTNTNGEGVEFLIPSLVDEARRICNACDHKSECAIWALHYERYGIWGGTTPAERVRTRNKLNIRVQEETNIA